MKTTNIYIKNRCFLFFHRLKVKSILKQLTYEVKISIHSLGGYIKIRSSYNLDEDVIKYVLSKSNIEILLIRHIRY